MRWFYGLVHERSITELSFILQASFVRDLSGREVAQTNRDGSIIVGVLNDISQLLAGKEGRFRQGVSY